MIVERCLWSVTSDIHTFLMIFQPSGEETGGQEGQVEIKQELPDWTESYGSDDNNEV